MRVVKFYQIPVISNSQTMHEILTIQLGHRANHVCTHFWNTQESYFSSPSSSLPTLTTSETHVASQDELVNHDIHWREGFDSAGRNTYTPRTLIYDLRGGFGGGLNWPGGGGGSLEQYQDPSEVDNSGVWWVFYYSSSWRIPFFEYTDNLTKIIWAA